MPPRLRQRDGYVGLGLSLSPSASADSEEDLVKRVTTNETTQYLLVQAFLCVLCSIVGALYPTLLDMSKTATEREVVFVDGSLVTRERRAHPFSPVTVVLVDDCIQLWIALWFLSRREGLLQLFADIGVVATMMPVGLVYAIGELLTLHSVQKGSGPVYVVISNTKLVLVAIMSRLVFGRSRSLPWLHWLELIIISLAAACYTVVEADSLGDQWHWEGAWLALSKSSLSSFISVFCEHSYKTNSFHVVLSLQALWGFVAIVFLTGLSFTGLAAQGIWLELHNDTGEVSFFGAGPRHPLCTSAAHALCVRGLSHATLSGEAACKCMSERGWNVYTLGTIVAYISNAASSALVFKRFSAVAKYVCRATSALPMYIFYCAIGRYELDLRMLSLVMFVCIQASVYTMQRYRASVHSGIREEDASWTPHYTGTRTVAPAA